MSLRPRFLIGTTVLLLLGLALVYIVGRLEPYTETLEHGPSPEARGNPYLAAEHFLRKQGLDVNRADGLEVLDRLPSAGHTLLLLGSRERMTPRQADRLLDWTSRGGHLLFIAERLYDEDTGKSGDLLADRLGVQQYESSDLKEDAEGEESADGDAAPADKDGERAEHDPFPELTKLYLENERAPAYVSFDTGFHLYDSQNRAHAWANSAHATHMLQLNQGDGVVTVLTDGWIWQNNEIDQYDNAWLLWYLSQDSAVTLLYRAERDSLATLLGRHFPEALVALGLLLILSLWHLGQRQGPLQAPASLARRQLEEHLRGSADFRLRHSGQAGLLQGLQKDIQRRARHRHPGFERLPVADQWQVLGRLTRLPPSAISQAMRPLPKQRLNAAEFTRQVAHLQTLRNAL
ncbi:DUF4350 domain-containing protein [Metapseudomonas furukawaii]|jgi:hypothetical protein|uniref:DUF4350 domain-containing protein n=1 Tax=Metapseudomonas furukawaii TaxID=1149133 RepID=A0AAD1BX65_METFU|nr:DUF4350 domain-containing protein [Pseudomonas furukawaii]ELS24932.1 Hypothetical protein ppKF707_5763 [Pseudomonas furukawaii]WAG80190.1 DUF4350 domain-containing protein [Pseudomonas furukawaii]BAU72827.1 hypothetical protein KF707C_11390 [Pseudomonas furukawaii]